MVSKGCSTALAPIHVKINTIEIKIQNNVFVVGLIFDEILFLFLKYASITIDIASATTPPSFDGIARRIAYANKKYHSGWIWVGALRGLAVL